MPRRIGDTMKIENIRKIGMKMKVKDLEKFVAFLNKRFPNENDSITSYFSEWADRFNSGHPTDYMDEDSLKIYNSV